MNTPRHAATPFIITTFSLLCHFHSFRHYAAIRHDAEHFAMADAGIDAHYQRYYAIAYAISFSIFIHRHAITCRHGDADDTPLLTT